MIGGGLVVALSEDEVPRLQALHERGRANGLTGLEWLSPEAAREIEPHVRCVAALRVPEEGIVDYAGVVARFAREGYSLSTIHPRDALESLTFTGLWRFLARHPRVASFEIARSMSKTLFVRSLQRLIPALRAADLLPGGSGVRAQAMRPDGALVEDFLLVEHADALHVLNVTSPTADRSRTGELDRPRTDRKQSSPCS